MELPWLQENLETKAPSPGAEHPEDTPIASCHNWQEAEREQFFPAGAACGHTAGVESGATACFKFAPCQQPRPRVYISSLHAQGAEDTCPVPPTLNEQTAQTSGELLGTK